MNTKILNTINNFINNFMADKKRPHYILGTTVRTDTMLTVSEILIDDGLPNPSGNVDVSITDNIINVRVTGTMLSYRQNIVDGITELSLDKFPDFTVREFGA